MKKENISKIIATILLLTTGMYTVPVFAYTKDETVYSKIDESGNEYKKIVSSHLTNSENEELLKDMTDLLNIKNTNGTETFEKNDKENQITWHTNKNDIYYQGETNKELPVKLNIKYELDGEEKNPKDIVGKTGKVKVTLNYENKDEHIVNINGKNQKMYTPFVVVAGTIIDNDKNKNIEITNGKIIDDGSKIILLGMAFPGLEKSLNTQNKEIKIPETIEITMDSKDFEMNSILTYITPKVIEKEDIEIFDKLENIYKKADILSKSSKELEDGTIKLKEGTNEYKGKMQEFETAMGKLTEGMTSANENYTKINEGINILKENTKDLNSGAKKVTEGIGLVETNLNTVNTKLEEIILGTKKLQGGEKELLEGIKLINSKIEKIPAVDNTSKIETLNNLVKTNENTIKSLKQVNLGIDQKLSIEGLDKETKTQLLTQKESNNSMIKLLSANNLAQKETINTLKATDANQIKELKQGLAKIEAGIKGISKGTDDLNSGIGKLSEGTKLLEEKTGELSKGSKDLYGGTNKLDKASVTLKTGSNQMKQGLVSLDENGNKILKANNQLTNASIDIDEGAKKLSEGMNQFNKEGIEKICNFINGDVKNLSKKIEKLEELSRKYNNFTMLEEGANGSVKFIGIVDAIKKEENKKDSKEKIIIDKKDDPFWDAPKKDQEK